MPKALCWTGIGVAIVVVVFFLLDLLTGFPFQKSSPLMDVAFILCAAVLGYLAWTTLKEQD